MKNTPLLYANPLSGHSYKVALMLTLTNTDFDYHYIDLMTLRDKRSESFRKASLFDEVPVLQIDQLTLCQSNTILLYLAEKLGQYGGETQTQKWHIHEWLSWEANRIGASLPNLRFLIRFIENPHEGVIEYFKERTENDLTTMNEHLEAHDFIAGHIPSIADFSCCGYLFWAHEAQLDIDQWVYVKRWLDRISRLPGWKSVEELLAKEVAQTT